MFAASLFKKHAMLYSFVTRYKPSSSCIQLSFAR